MTISALFPVPLSPPNSSPSLNINHSSLLIQMFLLLKIDAAHKSDLNSCTFLQFSNTIVIVIKNHRFSSSSEEFDEFFIFNISHSSLCVLFFVLFVQFICVIQQFFYRSFSHISIQCSTAIHPRYCQYGFGLFFPIELAGVWKLKNRFNSAPKTQSWEWKVSASPRVGIIFQVILKMVKISIFLHAHTGEIIDLNS